MLAAEQRVGDGHRGAEQHAERLLGGERVREGAAGGLHLRCHVGRQRQQRQHRGGDRQRQMPRCFARAGEELGQRDRAAGAVAQPRRHEEPVQHESADAARDQPQRR
jgi:hypothetical protein